MTLLSSFLDGRQLSTKVALMTVCAQILLSAITLTGARILLVDSAQVQGMERLDTNMRVAWSILDGLGKERSVRDGNMIAGNVILNDNDEAVDRITTLVGGSATIFQGDTRIATNVKKDDGRRATGTPLAAGPAREAVLGRGKPYRGEADILGKPYFTAYDPIKNAQGEVIGVLYVGIPATSFYAHVNRVGWQGLLVTVLVTALAAFICLRVAARLFRPLEGVTTSMKSLAEGNSRIAISDTDRPDEIGNIARALLIFRDAAVAKEKADNEQKMVVESLSNGLDRLSAGDMTADIRQEFPAGYATVRSNFNSALTSLRDLIGAAGESAISIRGGSQEIAQASEDLARRTEANAASLEESSAALIEIDNRLKATADAAGRTVASADHAITTVSGGRSVANEVVQAMIRVSESAKNIDSVIEGMDKIAFQTRVLAMNAAVEAGRAGEAGRGFAVVADLVSALAMRSEEEAKLAREQLTVTQAEIVIAVSAVQKVDGSFAGIADDVQQVHELLGDMAADNLAQSTAISQITVAIGTMNLSTQQNAAMVEETSAAARNLTAEVSKLTGHTARFNTGEPKRAWAIAAL
ncbi:methyl-accepting chemotaxis protein [Sphingobium sp.]|uniref:methyl-accepting chemotaxis protein n=1 Tax=Sphingobium sp. TaxID=1912891 RepID=UPI002CE09B2D|nr:cache domain-containing protein [Sphingobium sp.]HUD93114.1 cache domain-containing protein [Sphingobium sp.]